MVAVVRQFESHVVVAGVQEGQQLVDLVAGLFAKSGDGFNVVLPRLPVRGGSVVVACLWVAC